MPAQPEIEAYLNFVADRLDLRRDISLQHRSRRDDLRRGRRRMDGRDRGRGSPSSPRSWSRPPASCRCRWNPTSPGMDAFAGPSLYTSRWPKAGRRPHRQARRRHRHRFDRRATDSGRGAGRPDTSRCSSARRLTRCRGRCAPFEPGELDEMKARYGEIRAAQRQHPVGAARLSAFSVMLEMIQRPPLKSASREEQLRAIEENGVMGALSWGDVFFDIEANQMAAEALRRGRRPDRQGSRHCRGADAESSLRVQAPDHRPGLLRDVQPRQRHAGRPAQGADPPGHRRRASTPSRGSTSST